MRLAAFFSDVASVYVTLSVSTIIQQADLGPDLPAMVNIRAIIGSNKMTVDPSESMTQRKHSTYFSKRFE